MLRNIAIIMGFCFLLLTPLSAQNRSEVIYKEPYEPSGFRHLTINEGLSQNLVSSITQDHLGFMWIGTKDGLNMYDGNSFRIYRHNPFDQGSISDNYIRSIYSDREGRLWVGTQSGGLNLFDREAGRFIRFVHDPDDDKSISHNNVQAIAEDELGNIWIGTSGGGLNMLSRQGTDPLSGQETFVVKRFRDIINDCDLAESEIFSLVIDRYNTLWLNTYSCILVANLTEGDISFRQVPLQPRLSLPKNIDPTLSGGPVARFIMEDQDGELWLGNDLGLYTYHRDKQAFLPYRFRDPDVNIFSTLAAVSFINRGMKEICVSNYGSLFIINTQTRTHFELRNDKNKSHGLQGGQIISLFADRNGALWAGSNGYGLSLYDPYTIKFTYPNDLGIQPDQSGISSRDLSIRSFLETSGKENILWIGTNQGLYKVNRVTSEMVPIQITCSTGNSSPFVFSIREDIQGFLWLGTHSGLIRYNPLDGTYEEFLTLLQDPDGSKEPRVTNVFIRETDFWILTPNTIARFNEKNGSFEHYRFNPDGLSEFREASFPTLFQDNKGNFWIGSRNGLHYFDVPTKTFFTLVNDPADSTSLSYNDIRAILPDPNRPEQFLWLATAGGGLSRFDMQNKTFKTYTDKNGLANNMIYGMLSDELGNFWLSTNKGLSKFDVLEEKFTNFSVSDGLQSNEFNSGAFYKSPRGELFFGGIHGYNYFLPGFIKQKELDAPVVITAFTLLTDPSDKNKRSFANISETSDIRLRHNQNHFSVEFSSLDYASPEKNQFAYSMTSGGENWIYLGNTRTINFTNLKPGTYQLQVRGTNNDGVWSKHMARLSITISPPWWRQSWAIVVWLVLGFLVFLGIRQYEISRLRLRSKIKLATLETEKMKDIDHMKSHFFANISHEFRTPLTLIRGPIDLLMENATDPHQKKSLSIIQANSERLLNLINQLLDLSKLESGLYRISVSRGDISGLLRGLVMSFSDLAKSKHISLNYVESPSFKKTWLREKLYFDQDVMEKILTNLISNAIKFTPAKGTITVTACIRKWINTEGMFEISITDTGIGIAKDKLPFIYNRFYQLDSSSAKEQGGTGIGLAYVKEQIDAHKGRIAVMSKPGKGTTFRLRFPLGTSAFSPDQIVSEKQQTGIRKDNSPAPQSEDLLLNNLDSPEKEPSNGKSVILVVEDQEDVRHYISQSLQNEYHVLESSSAKDGIRLAEESIPDLIVSDVMMPVMDGFQFCQNIKSNEKTSHIPMILLTAKAEEKSRIQGLASGADDYLVKPFNTRELLARIKNLIETRHMMREKFSSNAVIKPSEISVTPRDRNFMEKMLSVVEKNMDNERFNVDELAREVGMSQSQLHRKLKALINQSANHFIKSVRMHRAMELLQKEAGTISEIAYKTGYLDPGYFTKSFKSFFGKLPSEFKKPSS
jgi:signal transduction histidine kinase/ligand-binding sensor domain-containing protein/DNA-binding response OmpR family regulator